MRQSSTPKRFLALALSAGILTGGLALNSTTASAAGWFDRFKRNWREAARKYREEDERAARNFQ